MKGVTDKRNPVPTEKNSPDVIKPRLQIPKSLLSSLGDKVYYLPLNRFSLDNMKWLSLKNAIISPIEKNVMVYNTNGGVVPYELPNYIACLVPLNNELKRQAIDRLLSFLKLFKDELPEIDFCLDQEGEGRFLSHYRAWPRDVMPPPFVIKKNEKASFKRQWKKFGNKRYKSFALSRFIRADFEPYDQNIPMYLIEALESLLCVGGRGETTFKFTSRGTVILGQKLKKEAKKELMEKLKKAYNYRSRLTHGENPKIPFDGFLSFLREKTRECICFFREYDSLSDAKRRNEIIEDMTIYNVKTISPKYYISA